MSLVKYPIRIGARFSRLVVTGPMETPTSKFPCVCDCGNVHYATSSHLRTGICKSCGCWKKERLGQPKTHGYSGIRKIPEYHVWISMNQRCYSKTCKRYSLYGARGIFVCNEWRKDFPRFLADMGRRPSPKHSLDRTNNDGPYAPWNCKWVTHTEQTRNTRRNRKLTFLGQTKCMSEWAEIIGVDTRLIFSRLKRGYPLEIAFQKHPIARSQGVAKKAGRSSASL